MHFWKPQKLRLKEIKCLAQCLRAGQSCCPLEAGQQTGNSLLHWKGLGVFILIRHFTNLLEPPQKWKSKEQRPSLACKLPLPPKDEDSAGRHGQGFASSSPKLEIVVSGYKDIHIYQSTASKTLTASVSCLPSVSCTRLSLEEPKPYLSPWW